MKQIIEDLLHPVISEEESARKKEVEAFISSNAEKIPEIKHFLGYSEVTVDLIASCVLDAAYTDDFIYNRYTSIPQDEHRSFMIFVSNLAETLSK